MFGWDYPEDRCVFHPNETWSWDQGWFCVSCVIDRPEWRPDFWVIEFSHKTLMHIHHWKCNRTETLNQRQYLTDDIVFLIIERHECKTR